MFWKRKAPDLWPYPPMNTVILGDTGSGKTTGSGALGITTLMRRNTRPGFLLSCSKADDGEVYAAYAKRTGRESDLIRITLDGPHGCDPLDVVMSFDFATPLAVNRLLEQAVDITEEGQKGGDSNQYFRIEGSVMRLHCITALVAASGTVRVKQIRSMLEDAPGGFADAICEEAIASALLWPEDFQEDIRAAVKYVRQIFTRMPDKQREAVRSTAALGLGTLCAYPIGRLLNMNTIHPDLLFKGAIIVNDVPAVLGHAHRLWSVLLRTMMEAICVARKPGTASAY